jgi:glycine/D-amino acid oxidase-like deaminating enzyme
MNTPTSKLAQLRAHMQAGRWQEALRIAARFPRLGEHRAAIVTAHEAWTHPGFYRQLGRDIEQLRTAGQQALCDRFGKQ